MANKTGTTDKGVATPQTEEQKAAAAQAAQEAAEAAAAGSDAGEDDAPKNTLSRRDQAMQDAIKAHQLARETSTEAITHPDLVAEFNGEETDEEREEREADEAAAAAASADDKTETDKKVASEEKVTDDTTKSTAGEPPIFEKDGVQMMRLKVNGEVIEMPVDKVQGIAQKNLLADSRLRQATELQKQLQQQVQEANAKATSVKDSLTQLPKSTGVEVDKQAIEAFSKDFIKTLFQGTEEEAIAKFIEFQSRGQSVDIEALIEQARETAKQEAISAVRAERQQSEQERLTADMTKGWQDLVKEYPDLQTDEVLFSMVDRRTEDLAADHPDWSPSKVMMEATREVASRMGIQPKSAGKKPTPTPASAPAASTRTARKENLVPVPRSQAGVRTPVNKEKPIDMSAEAVARRMQESRQALAGKRNAQ